MYIGSTEYSKVYVGSSAVDKIYKGTTQVYSAYIWDSSALALFARMSVQPSDDLKILINETIISLKAAGVWAKLDCLYMYNVHNATDACLNWIKNAHNNTLVNSPTFVSKMGFAGDGISKSILLNYQPSTQGVNFTLNNCSHGLTISRHGSTINKGYYGARQASSYLNASGGNPSPSVSFNTNNTNVNAIVPYTLLPGSLYSINRDNSTDERTFEGGINKLTYSKASAFIPDYNLPALAFNDYGTLAGWSDVCIKNLFFGASLTDQENADFANIINNYNLNVNYIIGFESETTSLLARMSTQPTFLMGCLIDKTILELKDSGIWAATKRLYNRRVHTIQAALLDWKNVSDSTAVNSPVFRAGYGIKGDKISKYLNNNFDPYSTLTNNSCGLFVWMTTAPSAGGLMIVGCTQTSFERYNIDYLLTPAARPTLGGQLGTSILSVANENLLSADRTSSNQMHAWRNGGNKTSPAINNNGGLPNTNLLELANGTTGAPTGYSDVEIGWSGYYDNYTDIQQAYLYGILKYYNNNIDILWTLTNDYNTVAWFDSSDASTIIKDGSNYVSLWKDKVRGNDLIQNTATNQPLWSSDGILFDGIDNFMKTIPFTLNQPETIYIVLKNKTWATYDTFFDGDTNNTGNVLCSISTPNIYASAPTTSADNNNLSLDTWSIIRVLFSGASSKLIVNNTSPITWNCGTNNMSGFTLGKIGTASLYYGNIQVKEIIIRNIADSTTNETTIYNYLVNKYNIT